jgi:F-type H+-transporting ATPase subunit gamma
MPSLKEFRVRIDSVKSTRKITSAMKMVAASKLKRAQEQAEAARPYAERMATMLQRLAANVQAGAGAPKLMAGTGSDHKQLIVVVTSDRGLCGGFNGNLVREVRRKVRNLLAAGKEVKLVCVGRKGRDLLRRDYASLIVASFEGIGGKKKIAFAEVQPVADKVLALFEAGEADIVTLFYNHFKSVIAQVPTDQQLIPFAPAEAVVHEGPQAVYEYEPSEEAILATLLPKNVGIQIFRALLDSAAGEQGARMSAMDNATRNASDMIAKLTLRYNRARQAYITKELIEIISGAEAL